MSAGRLKGGLPAALALCACYTLVPAPQPPGPPLPIAPGAFPHQALDAVLAKYVDARGKVDYRALRADRLELERYLAALARTSPRKEPGLFPTRADKLAYWINGYNAYVLYAVTERPGMRAVNEEAKSFFYFSRYRFGDEQLSLYTVENDILRAELKEPRIHFALNCASLGCPELPAEAFLPARLEEQLEREATKFCASEKRVQVEAEVVQLSQIFDWYAADFAEGGGPLAFCRRHGRADLPDKEVELIPYDWALNAQPGKALYE